jgi:ribonuclease HI
MKKVILYTDGGARGNPGPAGIGAVLTDEAGVVIKEASLALGKSTNNEAEYQAGILGFKTIKELYTPEELQTLEIEHKLDSELVCKQLRGEYKIKEPRLKDLWSELTQLIGSLGVKVTYTHIRRELNKEADRLANEAMDRAAEASGTI